MFKHILVPTDGSELSKNMVKRAVSFAKEAGAKITAFNAKPEYPLPLLAYSAAEMDRSAVAKPEHFDENAEKEAQKILGEIEKLCQKSGVACAKLTKTSDHVYQAIIEAATQSGCDLIFMASHGRRGIGALLLGSETTKVLTHSKIPVLIYR